jgi:3-deoxy-manno-octulosonate cytidylyltransferase (CMP-KDO synthetase)
MNKIKNRKFVIVIPARFKSSRFPGKPLAKIKGKPMIYHVWMQCIKAVSRDNVFIATDDKKIQDVCKTYSMNCQMTSSKCKTGTDRMYDFSKKISSEIYINVQGDEPQINPKDIKKIVNLGLRNKDKIFNGMCKIKDHKDGYKSQVPKVVFDKYNNLMYMSRAPIPNNKYLDNKHFYKQICIYSIPKKYLKIFGTTKKTKFEKIEDIEINRFLELGYKVKMIELSDTISVDYPSDLKLLN